MKKTLRILALLLSFLMITGLFAACNNNNTGDGNETTKPPADEIVLIVGTNPEFPPFEFLDDNGEMDGFDVALIKEMGDRMGMTVKMEAMEFKSLIAAIGGRIDIAIAAMTITEDRKESVDFTDSYFDAKQYVLVAADNDAITSVGDLTGLKLGVQEGTTGDFIATDIADADETGETKVSRYSKAVQAVMDLASGRLDAVIVDKNPAMEFANTNDKVKIISDDFFEDEFYGIAVPKDKPELLQKLNDALAEVIADGTFDTLLEKYGLKIEAE